MDGVIPARHGNGAPVRYTWDEEGAVRNIEPLEKYTMHLFLHIESNKTNS